MTDSLSDNRPIGLIAGQGRLPLLVAEGARAAGRPVRCLGLRHQYDAGLPAYCDAFRDAGLMRLGGWIRTLRRWEVTEAIMVGRVAKVAMHDPLKWVRQIPDWRTLRLWYGRLRHDRRNAAVLAAVTAELADHGIRLIDSTTYIPDHLATEGVMGSASVTPSQQADIDFGWPLLEQILGLDVGQAIAVRERDVIAVEAVEGTQGMIERAGTLCRSRGWTMLKSCRADHDRRADVPTIGVETIEQLHDAGAGCLALGAGRVIMIDRPAVIAAADARGIAIVGLP